MVCGVESVENIIFSVETHIGWLKNYLSYQTASPVPTSFCGY
jgi:hypothetical protein